MEVINPSKSRMKVNHRKTTAAAAATTTVISTATTTTTATIHSHEVGKDLIPELAMRVYSSHFDSFREAISNAFDENSQKVVLSIADDKIVIEDWGNGIQDYDEFRKFGNASKKSRKGEVIGEKGLGKLSLLNLGSEVSFETNNGKMAMKFYMTLEGFSTPTYRKNTTAFLSHRGTKITITKLATTTTITTTPNMGELTEYLKKAFGLRLAQGAKVILNNQSIKPRLNLDPKEQFLFELKKVKDADANVTGNLKAADDGRGIVDLYVDHVFVTSLEVDTRRKFDGWINCNALTPETSRNNIVQNSVYREFIYLLRRYSSRFPLRDISIDEHKLMLSRELNALLKNYLKDMRIKVQPQLFDGNTGKDRNRSRFDGLQLSTTTSSGSSIEEKSMSGTISIKEKKLTDPSIKISDKEQEQEQQQQKNIQSSFAIRWEFADLGNEKEPVYFVPPNVIYCNTSNDLYKFAMDKNRRFGPTWIRMLPYLARVAVAMGPESVPRLSPEQLNRRVDEATRYFLRQKKVI
jgi:hypothetical protein